VKVSIEMTVNDMTVRREIKPNTTLLEFIREKIGLTGTKAGCENGECGACTVIMDGKPVRSCIILAVEANGAVITTVEGLAQKDKLHPLQQSFIKNDAVQCGFCTPGMLMAAKALYDRTTTPNEGEIVEAMSGHLCRCTGYKSIEEAIKDALRTKTNSG
jgi:carbon-monoxide dehydrogenase small subunit